MQVMDIETQQPVAVEEEERRPSYKDIFAIICISILSIGLILRFTPANKHYSDNYTLEAIGFYRECNTTSMKSVWLYMANDVVYSCNFIACNETQYDVTTIQYNAHNHLCVEQYGFEAVSIEHVNESIQIASAILIAIGSSSFVIVMILAGFIEK